MKDYQHREFLCWVASANWQEHIHKLAWIPTNTTCQKYIRTLLPHIINLSVDDYINCNRYISWHKPMVLNCSCESPTGFCFLFRCPSNANLELSNIMHFKDQCLHPFCYCIFVDMYSMPGHLTATNLQVFVSIYHCAINHVENVKLLTGIYRFQCNIPLDLCVIKQHHEFNQPATWEPGWLWQGEGGGGSIWGKFWGCVVQVIGWGGQWRGPVCM